MGVAYRLADPSQGGLLSILMPALLAAISFVCLHRFEILIPAHRNTPADVPCPACDRLNSHTFFHFGLIWQIPVVQRYSSSFFSAGHRLEDGNCGVTFLCTVPQGSSQTTSCFRQATFLLATQSEPWKDT